MMNKGGTIMWKPKYQRNNKGFTLTELIITILIIAVIAGIGTIAVVKIRGSTRQVTCMSNLKAVSSALQLYYNDYKVFPDDGYPDNAEDMYPLAVELSDYISILDTYLCPLDDDATSIANLSSYDPFYVKRTSADQTEKIEQLAVGCPRHRQNDSSTSLFSTGYTEITKVGTVLANGQAIPPDGNSSQRKISNVNDVMTFADGSIVTITSSVANYGVYLMQSDRLSDGTLYSIIRIHGDGTIDNTVATCVQARFQNTGQSCIAGKRLLLHKSIEEEFLDKLKKEVIALKSGNPLEEDTYIGTMAREDLAEELEEQLKASIKEGAKILIGGKRTNAYFEPTIVTNVTPEMSIFKEETFGPVLSVTTFNTDEEAVDLVNQSDFGLGVSIFTENDSKIEKLIPLFEDGAVFVNELVKSDPRLPFGGTKISGYGRELSEDGIKEFVNKKAIMSLNS